MSFLNSNNSSEKISFDYSLIYSNSEAIKELTGKNVSDMDKKSIRKNVRNSLDEIQKEISTNSLNDNKKLLFSKFIELFGLKGQNVLSNKYSITNTVLTIKNAKK